MCGINGVIYKTKTDNTAVRQQLTVMNDLIVHRGPDADGTFAKSTDSYAVGMAMRRLSIIDFNSDAQ